MNIAAADILKAFNFRHATKSYDASKKVSDADFHTILEAGRLSPSSFGFEPWKFLVIERQDIKDKLFPLAWGAQNSLRGASHFVIVLARKKVDTLYSSPPYITHIMRDVQHLPEDAEQGRKAAFEAFQKDDFNLLESDRAIFDWASKQTYLALANMMTTAAMLGIDSCPIEGFNRSKVEAMLAEEGLLDKEHFGVSVMASFGYHNDEPYAKTRQAMEDIVTWVK